jgi:hypothetical protein
MAATKLYLDTEFNAHQGDLISIGLVSEDGAEFYAVAAIPFDPHPWVRQHVLPVLDGQPIGRAAVMQDLKHFLMPLGSLMVFADWPADFEHFFSLLAGAEFMTAYVPELVGVLRPPPKTPLSAVPHNALSDARALREAWLSA